MAGKNSKPRQLLTLICPGFATEHRGIYCYYGGKKRLSKHNFLNIYKTFNKNECIPKIAQKGSYYNI